MAGESNDRAVRFRPSARGRARIAIGVLMAVIAVAVILGVFANLDTREPVLQLTRDVPAGEMITPDAVRIVEISSDPSLDVTPSDRSALVVGMYAKVRMTAGSLLSESSLQSEPLVGPGAAIVAIEVSPGQLPIGLRERSQVLVVFPPSNADEVTPESASARVVGLPTAVDQITGTVSLSLELPAEDAAVVARAANVRIVLLEPGVDAASANSTQVEQPVESQP